MRDRVILMVGLYDTLDIFTYELKKEFEKIGHTSDALECWICELCRDWLKD